VSFEKVGDVLVAQGTLPEALKSYRDSLAIRDRLGKIDPGNAGWQRDLAISFAKVGSVLLRQQHPDEARPALVAGREIIVGLMKRLPGYPQLKQDLAWFDGTIAGMNH